MVIAKLISEHPFLHLLAQYDNTSAALSSLKEQPVDLIFLDVEMPVLTGFDLLESLDPFPNVIIVSGKVEYAFKAFKYNAIDYLQKPIVSSRFKEAVRRVHEKLMGNSDKVEGAYISIKSNYRRIKVRLHKILWIEALGDYIKLITPETNHVVLTTMKSFEKRLPEDMFFRVHKSYIVNVRKIDSYSKKYVEINKKKIPLSRRKKALFEDIFI